MGSAVQRLLVVLIAIAVSVLMRPSELSAADAPTTVRCGQSDEVVLHNPPRPAILARHHGAALDDECDALEQFGAEVLAWLDHADASSTVALARSSSVLARHRKRWRPPTRGPPAFVSGANAIPTRSPHS